MYRYQKCYRQSYPGFLANFAEQLSSGKMDLCRTPHGFVRCRGQAMGGASPFKPTRWIKRIHTCKCCLAPNFCSTTWPEKESAVFRLGWECRGHSWMCTYIRPLAKVGFQNWSALDVHFPLSWPLCIVFFLGGGWGKTSTIRTERSTPMFLLEPWQQLFFFGGKVLENLGSFLKRCVSRRKEARPYWA